MTFVAAVAAGDTAAGSLERHCAERVALDAVTVVRHADLALAWDACSPWVDAHDDGDVLVVLDGRLHNLWSDATGPAELLWLRYRERGTELARGLLGDFVVIVLDRRRRTLVVARDPVGVRPWYQATTGRNRAGATDLATLASLPWVDTAVDERIAIEYLAAVWESRGETLYRGARTLRPGQTWEHGPTGERTFAHHRWELEPDLGTTWDEAIERCRALLDDAVGCRIRPGEPPSSELSGGLDSSAVVGTAVRLGYHDIVAGRLVFEGPRADERLYSGAVLEHWGLRAVSVPPWTPTADEAVELTRSLRRPLPDPHFTMFASLYRRFLEDGRPNGLTGLGGDDAFATCRLGGRVVSAFKLRQRSVVVDLARSAMRHPAGAWAGTIRPTLHHLAPWRGDRLPMWVSPAAAAQAELPRLYRRRAPRVTGIDAIDERLANLTTGYDAAILEMRAVVADGVRRRDSHPFLDPRVIEGTYGLDPWWPTRGGHTRALQVAAYLDRLPPAVAERQWKADFSEVFWPQVLDDETLHRVRTGPVNALGWLDPDGFERLIANAKGGMANAAIPLSRCISVDRWLRSQ